MTNLMLEAQGPQELFAVFQEDEGAGFFFVFRPANTEVIAQIRLYESGFKPNIRENDIQLMWSSDKTKCGIAIWGQLRGVINIATGDETCVPLEDSQSEVTNSEWIKGFEKNYLSQRSFVRSRQRYWKETVKEQAAGAVQVLPEDETPIQTNFVIYAINSNGQAAVFEDEGETGYLYLYSMREQTIIRYLHIYDRSEKVTVFREDIEVAWSANEKKCGVAVWGMMRGIIDVASDLEGRVWIEDRNTPGIGDREWLKGF